MKPRHFVIRQSSMPPQRGLRLLLLMRRLRLRGSRLLRLVRRLRLLLRRLRLRSRLVLRVRVC